MGRFGSPDPMTESPFSTQGWNRYSYVGNSPVNFTDPSGYCFMGCFWQPAFKAIGNFFERNWVAILQVAATAMCGGNPACAGVVAFAVTGVTSGDLGMAFRAGVTAFITATAFQIVGQMLGGNTSNSGPTGAPIDDARAAFYAQYGPPMYQTQLPGIYVQGAPLSPNIPMPLAQVAETSGSAACRRSVIAWSAAGARRAAR